MATTISDLSNAGNKDGLLKDVYLDDKKKKKAKEGRKSAEKLLHKTRFGPHESA